MLRYFVTGFGNVPDLRQDMFCDFSIGLIRNHPLATNIFMAAIMILVLIFGVSSLRAPLLLLLSLHPLDIAFMAIGNHVINRYVVVTGWSWTLAFFLAVYSLGRILFSEFSKHSGRRKLLQHDANF